MSRNIKFRAWDDKNKKWLLGFEHSNLGGFSMFGECMLFEEWSRVLSLFLFERDGYKNTDLILMQFTELQDIEKTDCYEGDILDNLEVVKFSEGCFMTSIGALVLSINHRKIIGNIYENPELLNKE